MANNQETKAFDLLEVRHFWLLSSMLKLHRRTSGPLDPKVLELCDDIKIMALHTSQPTLRARCEAALAECNRPITLEDAAVAL